MKAHAIAGCLLFIFFLQAFLSLPTQSMTMDEINHFSAGYSYWKTNDFRLNPEHPPLIKLISALPLLPLPLHSQFYGQRWEAAQKYSYELSTNTTNQYAWIHQFYFVDNDAYREKILSLSRIPMVLLGVLLGFIIYLFARDLYGSKAALLSLTLYAFSPNFLAHTRYVTTDVGVACFSLLAIWRFYHYVKNPTLKEQLFTGAGLGLALASKFTAVYLLPIMGAVVFLQPHTKRNYKTLFKQLMIILCMAALVLTLSYGIINIGRYFEGLSFVITHSSEGHPAYLLGQHSSQGWWYYFIIAFFVKTPIPTILIFLLSIIIAARMKNTAWKEEIFLIIPMAVFLGSFLISHLHIGIRHIFPFYAFMFVYAGKAVFFNHRLRTIALSVLLAWLISGTVMISPHYLSYFNILGGGPARGSEILIDSNIDWGQDIGRIPQWAKTRGIEKVNLALFGSDKSAYEQLSFEELGCYPKNGIAVISISKLRGIYEDEIGCYTWLEGYPLLDRIGYSINVFNITNVTVDEHQQLCETYCPGICESKKLIYFGSYYKEKCICDCRKPLRIQE